MLSSFKFFEIICSAIPVPPQLVSLLFIVKQCCAVRHILRTERCEPARSRLIPAIIWFPVPPCYFCLQDCTKFKHLFLQAGSPISNPYFSRPFFGFRLRLQKVGRFHPCVVCYQLLLSNGKSEEAGRVMIELLGTYTTENASQAREEAQRCIIASLAGTVQTLPRSVGYAAVLEIRDILVPYL